MVRRQSAGVRCSARRRSRNCLSRHDSRNCRPDHRLRSLSSALLCRVEILSRAGTALPGNAMKVFLTGASSGIGLATASLLTQRGHQVWGTSRDLTRLPQNRRSASGRSRFKRCIIAPRDFPKRAGGSGRSLRRGDQQRRERLFWPGRIVIIRRTDAPLSSARLWTNGIDASRFAVDAQSESAALSSTSRRSPRACRCLSWPHTTRPKPLSLLTRCRCNSNCQTGNVRLVDLQPADINTSFNDVVTRANTEDARVARAWEATDRNMKAAPKPELVAKRIFETDRAKRSAAAPRGGRFVSSRDRSAHLSFSAATAEALGFEKILWNLIDARNNRCRCSDGGHRLALARVGRNAAQASRADARATAHLLHHRIAPAGRSADVARGGRRQWRRSHRGAASLGSSSQCG